MIDPFISFVSRKEKAYFFRKENGDKKLIHNLSTRSVHFSNNPTLFLKSCMSLACIWQPPICSLILSLCSSTLSICSSIFCQYATYIYHSAAVYWIICGFILQRIACAFFTSDMIHHSRLFSALICQDFLYSFSLSLI